MATLGATNKMIVKTTLARRYFLDLAGDKTTFISGSGRSGTSWLANICNYRNDFRYMFEPLNPSTLPEGQAMQHWCLQVGDTCDYLDRVMRGRVRGAWVDSRNRCFIGRRRLIKEIRSNFMLGWILHNYPDTQLITMVRNPLSVATSRINLAQRAAGQWVWQPTLADLLNEPYLQKLLTDTEFTILNAQIGQGIAMETLADWCINNVVAKRTFDINLLNLVHYENLISKPEKTVRTLFEAIDIPYHANVTEAIKTPSETARRASSERGSNKAGLEGNDWRTILGADDFSRASDLLSHFDFSHLYSEQWQPVND